MKIISILKFIILALATFSLIGGCGSGNSGSVVGANSANSSAGTGSIAAKIVWSSSPPAKAANKTLYAAPTGVTTIKVFVFDSTMTSLITPKDFAASAGSGTIDGIPVGTDRIVRVQGLDNSGYLLYEATVPGIPVVLGAVTTVPITMSPSPSSTSANPASGTSTGPLTVTLTSQSILPPVTIFYSTYNAGATPPLFAQYSGLSPVQNIPVYSATPVSTISVILEFFSRNSAGAVETKRTQTYTITP